MDRVHRTLKICHRVRECSESVKTRITPMRQLFIRECYARRASGRVGDSAWAKRPCRRVTECRELS